MKFITMSAMFDDMDTAELAARSLTHHFSGIKSVKLHQHREAVLNADSYSSNSLTAAMQTNYVNVGYGVIPPQGAAPMFAVYQQVKPKASSYSTRKIKLTAVVPSEKKAAITSCLISSGGHFVKATR